jgi:serine/threonine protein kinase
MANLIGQSLGRYHILEQLGEGGMATVYKAYDTRLERDVAVKIIRRGAFPPDQLERMLKRFEREAKSLARLTHPNIVGVIDYGDHEGAPYLVMPYLPGGTLKKYIQEHGQIPWQEAMKILLPIAEALAYAHSQNIIHRDVKPSNIILTEGGQPMLTDFGVAKLFDLEETAELTGTGMGVGTPEYMAPEQFQGKAIDGRVDMYSLGVVFFEMLTGRKPYQADTPAAIIWMQASEPLPRPGQFAPGMPGAVEKVLLEALAKKPEDRYADMGTFAGTLVKIQSETNRPGKSTQKPSEKKGQLEERWEKTRTTNRNWVIGLVMVGVAFLGILGGWFIGKPAPVLPTEALSSIQRSTETITHVPNDTSTMTTTIDLPSETPILSTITGMPSGPLLSPSNLEIYLPVTIFPNFAEDSSRYFTCPNINISWDYPQTGDIKFKVVINGLEYFGYSLINGHYIISTVLELKREKSVSVSVWAYQTVSGNTIYSEPARMVQTCTQ